MKQLGLGFIQYSQDYDERLPMGTQPYGLNPSYYLGIGWGGQVYPYVKNSQVFACPSDTTPPTAATRVTVSYAANLTLTTFNPSSSGNAQRNMLTQIPAPERSVLMNEMQGSEANVSDTQESGGPPYTCADDGVNNTFCLGGNAGGNDNGNVLYATGYMGGRTYVSGACAFGSVPLATGCYAAPTGRHLDGANYCMADGHVKWYLGSRVSNGNNATNSTDPQGTVNDTNSTAAGSADPSGRFAVTYSEQ
jgi:prepilin-type processing-associated H-X9-DG protein